MAEHELLPWQSEDDVPPEQVELPPVPLGLHPAQREVFDGLKRFNVCVAGRRFGKTYLAVKIACWHLRHTHRADGTSLKNSDVWYVAPTLDLALETVVPMIYAELGEEIAQHHKVQNFFRHENGRTLRLKSGARPELLRGRDVFSVILDEYSTMPAGLWETIIRPSLVSSEGFAFFIGTPIGKGRLYDVYIDAQSNPDLWGTWKYHTVDNPTISKVEVQSAARSMSESQFKQEFEADWDVGGGQVFNPKHLKTGDYRRGVFNIAAVFGSDIALAKDAHLLRGSESAIIVSVFHPGGWHILHAIRGFWGVSELVRRISQYSLQYGARYLCLSSKDQKACENLLREYQRHQDIRLTPRFQTISDETDVDRIKWALQSRLKDGRITAAKGKGRNQLMTQLSDFPLEYSSSELVQALSYFDQLPEMHFGRSYRQRFRPLDYVAGY